MKYKITLGIIFLIATSANALNMRTALKKFGKVFEAKNTSEEAAALRNLCDYVGSLSNAEKAKLNEGGTINLQRFRDTYGEEPGNACDARPVPVPRPVTPTPVAPTPAPRPTTLADHNTILVEAKTILARANQGNQMTMAQVVNQLIADGTITSIASISDHTRIAIGVEIRNANARPAIAPKPVRGGAPAGITHDQFQEILKTIRENVANDSFDGVTNTITGLGINPADLTAEQLKACRDEHEAAMILRHDSTGGGAAPTPTADPADTADNSLDAWKTWIDQKIEAGTTSVAELDLTNPDHRFSAEDLADLTRYAEQQLATKNSDVNRLTPTQMTGWERWITSEVKDGYANSVADLDLDNKGLNPEDVRILTRYAQDLIDSRAAVPAPAPTPGDDDDFVPPPPPDYPDATPGNDDVLPPAPVLGPDGSVVYPPAVPTSGDDGALPPPPDYTGTTPGDDDALPPAPVLGPDGSVVSPSAVPTPGPGGDNEIARIQAQLEQAKAALDRGQKIRFQELSENMEEEYEEADVPNRATIFDKIGVSTQFTAPNLLAALQLQYDLIEAEAASGTGW